MDFGSLSGRASMKRKSLLAALGKPPSRQSAIAIPFNPPPSAYHASPASAAPASAASSAATPSSAHFPPSSASVASSDDHAYGDGLAESSRASATTAATSAGGYGVYGGASGLGGAGSVGGLGGVGGRSVSGMSGASAGGLYAGARDRAAGVKRPEDVFRLVKDRLLSWSYLMQWYQGDVFWLNTLRVPRSALEAHLGAKTVDARARSFLVLGASLAALLDVASAEPYLRAVLRLLDEWETWAEGGGKGVKNLFRGPRSKRPSGADVGDAETLLVNVALPFQPDFFLVHASTCSIMRDVYKKLLAMVLPARPRGPAAPPAPPAPPAAAHLPHPATVIASAPLDGAYTSAQHSREPSAVGPDAAGHDALQQLILGELPVDHTLVGEGQKMSPQVVELILKVDARLKKHFSVLLREGDALARKVLDDELAALVSSMTAGPPMRWAPDERAYAA